MGLLDTLFGQDDPTKTSAADNGTSSFAGLSPQASDNVSGMLSAIGQGMLAGNRYQWINPQVFAAAIKEQGSEADRAQQKRALKLILKQSNPSLSDAQLDVMANDPITAKLALSQNEAQAGTKAGQQASGIMGNLFGGGAAPSRGAAPAASGGDSSGGQIPGSLSLNDSDNDTAIRTVLAEAGNQGAEGMQAVAGVLRNRALLAGTSVSAEALKPNQFEPWNPDSGNDPRRFKPDSPEYQRAAAAVLPVLRGEAPDPTGGATHFYAPKAQAALGRDAPSWDDGSGVDLGGHRFFRRPYAGKDPSVLAQRGAPNVQVADASGSVPLPDPLANFTPSPGGGADNPDPAAPRSPFGAPITDGSVPAPSSAASTASIPPIGTNRSPAPPAPSPLPGTRDAGGNVRVANNENETQVFEGRMGMYPRNVYGVVPPTQAPMATAQADMPAPGAQNTDFFIPPGGSGQAPQQGRGAQPASGGGAPDFPLNDPKVATAAIPKLFQVLAIPNLPDAQKTQAKAALDYALNVVKPTQRAQDLMQAGFTPGTPEYMAAYKRQLSDNRPSAVQEYEYGKSDPGFDAYRDKRAAKAEPQISAQVAQRREAAEGLGLKPGSPGYQSYVLTGKMPNEDKPGPSAGDKKAIMSAEDEIPVIDNTIASLNRAKELNPQTYTGKTAAYYAAIGTSGVPGAGIIADTGKAGKTREFNQLMSMEAIQSMSKTLKGATTDAEMGRFMEILGDPSTPPDIRGKTIDRMLTLAERQKELATSRVEELRGGTYYNPNRQQSGGTAAAPRAGSQSNGATRPAFAAPDLEAEARRRGLIQ